MKQILVFFISLCGFWLSSTQATLTPAKDARSHFAAEFYRRTHLDLKKENENIIISPAATQKLLTTFYKGVEQSLADRLLFDIGIKHIDWERLIYDTFEETGSRDTGRSLHLKRRQMKELAEIIDKDVVIQYFEQDFKDINDSVQYENYIVTPVGITPTEEYKEFAKNYFNTQTINADSSEVEQIKAKFGDSYKAGENVDLYSNVEVKAEIKGSLKLSNGNIDVFGEAKYNEDRTCQYVVLPLDNGLKLFIALPLEPKEFYYFITQIIGRSMKVFEDYEKDDWKTENILVRLPPLKYESINDLAVHFKEVSNAGLKKVLNNDAGLSVGYENWPVNGPTVEHIWQRVSIDIDAENNNNAIKEADKIVDATGRNFFFAIYNDNDYYVLGHFIVQ